MSNVTCFKASYETVTNIPEMINWLKSVEAAMLVEIDNWTYTGSGGFLAKIAALDEWTVKHLSQMANVSELWITLDHDRAMAKLNDFSDRLDAHRASIVEFGQKVDELKADLG